jgi:hypothetical protein
VAIQGRSSAIVGSGENRFSAVLLRATVLLGVFGLPVVFACARIAEAPRSGLTWLRVIVASVSIGIVVFAKHRDIARRVLLAFLLETASGLAIFAYIDVPFVTSHDRQIANRVAAGYTKLTNRSIQNDMRGLTRMH